MANNNISNKKDREKAKQQKRLNKLKRKEERRDNAATSFDDMIAYVDEFGGLHSEPQTASKTTVKPDEINVSTPKQPKVAVEETTLTGWVDFFNASKGYGFIKRDDNREEIFFHISNAPAEIKQGDKVSFEIQQGMRGPTAVRISITNNQ